MAQRLRVLQKDETWVMDTIEGTKTGCVEVLNVGFRYKNFRVIKYKLIEEFGKYRVDEWSIPGRCSPHEDGQVKRWSKLEDGIYRLQWGDITYDENWKPIPMFMGCNWRIRNGCFKGLKVPQRHIMEELIAFEKRQNLQLVILEEE